MNATDVGLLVDYHYWARDRVIDAVSLLTPEQYARDLGSSFKSVRDTMAHLYSAEWVWYSRWMGESPTALLNPETSPELATLSGVRTVWQEMEKKFRAHVAGLGEAGLTTTVSYKLFNGQPFVSPYWQMIQHLVNHGSYHRGQVTTMLRQLGASPAKSMDMIAFYRERAQAS